MQFMHANDSAHSLKVNWLTCMHSAQLMCQHFTWPRLPGNQISALLIWTVSRRRSSRHQLPVVVTNASTALRARGEKSWEPSVMCSISEALHWLVTGNPQLFLRLFLVAFLLCWTAAAGGDSGDGTEGRDDMQQRSRGGDVSCTSTRKPYSSLSPCFFLTHRFLLWLGVTLICTLPF